MKIVLITGTAYRHLYYANTVIGGGNVVLHIKETRSNALTDEVKDKGYSAEDLALLQAHSDLRTAKEKQYFLPLGESALPVPESIEVSKEDLNSEKVAEAIARAKPDVLLVYGTALLREPILKVAPKWTINLHAGLSPWFRGAATLFWPIYFMKPQQVGYTFHIIDPLIDHGAIIHQNRPTIEAGDTIHDLGCKTIVVAAQDMLKLLPKMMRGDIVLHDPTSKGKIFYESEFKPYHLRVTDFLMRQGLFREYLAHPELFPQPTLISQTDN